VQLIAQLEPPEHVTPCPHESLVQLIVQPPSHATLESKQDWAPEQSMTHPGPLHPIPALVLLHDCVPAHET
jgi:hypothetical protein